MKKIYFILVALITTLFCGLFYSTSLDYKIQDVFISTRPSLKQNKEFYLISLDDKAIKHVGYFPFTRDIYGDLLLLLKESDTNTVVFDLSFYDSSKDEDYDDYFSKCISVFENVYIGQTLTNKSYLDNEEELTENTSYSEKSVLPFLKVIDDSLTPEYDLCLPPVETLENETKGTGFVIAKDDKDGYMRRIHLISKYNDKYHGQLMFRALLNYLNNPEILVSKNNIILKNVEIEGNIKDIKIPRSSDGSFLLKYPDLQFKDYNNISASYLLDIIDNENDLNEEIEFLNDLDFFVSVPDKENPYLLLQNLYKYKENLLYKTDENNPVSFVDYMVYKNEYYNSIKKYLTGNSINWVFELYTSQEDKDNISKNFQILNEIYSSLIKEKKELKSLVKNTICTIGTAASSTGDYTNTFYENHAPCFLIHQVIANQIYSEDFTDDCEWWISYIIAFIICISYSLAAIYIKGFKKKLFIGLGFIFSTILFIYIFFLISDIYIGLTVPFFSIFFTIIISIIMEYVFVHKEKSYIINAFGHYLSKDVVNEIIKDPSKLNLGGEDREMTALFTDIRSFTTICDKLNSPQKVVNLLNKYLSLMSDIILSFNGTIDKFEGDAIISFFGAPIHMQNHAELACFAALEMKRVENQLNEELLMTNETPIPLFTRIGINTGLMTVGNMGTNTMMNYTMMGSNVNLASRLEGLNKRYNTRGIIISEHTRREIGNKFLVRSLEKVLVVGSENPVMVFELLAENNNPKLETYVESWEKAMSLYNKMEYEKAQEEFNALENLSKNDGVLNYFQKQCIKYIENPPEKDWDGVIKLTVK